MKPLPCPFCGKVPKVLPSNPKVDGNAWAAVQCVNERCPAQPRVKDGARSCDERGSAAYKQAAIRRWNRRSCPTTGTSRMTYNPEAVRRILKAKRGKMIRAPDNPDAFMRWLECEKDDAPVLTHIPKDRVWRIGGKVVSEEEGKAAFQAALKASETEG